MQFTYAMPPGVLPGRQSHGQIHYTEAITPPLYATDSDSGGWDPLPRQLLVLVKSYRIIFRSAKHNTLKHDISAKVTVRTPFGLGQTLF